MVQGQVFLNGFEKDLSFLSLEITLSFAKLRLIALLFALP